MLRWQISRYQMFRFSHQPKKKIHHQSDCIFVKRTKLNVQDVPQVKFILYRLNSILIILGQAHPDLSLFQPNTDLDTFMSILARQSCNTREVVQAFSAFLHSEGGGLFSGLDSLLYQSNLQDIFTLSVLPGADGVVQPLIHSDSTLWHRAVEHIKIHKLTHFKRGSPLRVTE